ncbi:MAG: DnaJ domain-containing protein [Deltaproteobacteria bacterium]|nr:DnaJ domain-containing protein [Deltaproteobacteria bacterium]
MSERLRAVDVDATGKLRPYAERIRRFDAYKVELKKTHRAIALECHPDRTRDEPEPERAEKEARFKRVTRAVEHVMKLVPRPPQRQTPPLQRMQGEVVIIVAAPFIRTATTPTSTTATSSITFGSSDVFFGW